MRRSRSAAALLLCAVASGCMVGPDYKKPDAPASAAFKELTGWKPSTPRDDVDKGAWWAIYNDPELDRLERMVEVSNQTVKQFEAQYRNAVALVGEARAALFPDRRAEQRRDALRRWRAAARRVWRLVVEAAFGGGEMRGTTRFTVSVAPCPGTSTCGAGCGVRWKAMSREPR